MVSQPPNGILLILVIYFFPQTSSIAVVRKKFAR